MTHAGLPAMEDVIDDLVTTVLSQASHAGAARRTDWDAFLKLSSAVHARFQVPTTTITPAMRRLLYGIASRAQPRVIIGAGTYVGYALAWLAGAMSEMNHLTCIGLDTDAKANVTARANYHGVKELPATRFLTKPAQNWLAQHHGEIDLLYIDVDSPTDGKASYQDIIAAGARCLRAGSIVLAHDAAAPKFTHDLHAYHEWISDTQAFLGPWILSVDECGLSVSVKT